MPDNADVLSQLCTSIMTKFNALVDGSNNAFYTAVNGRLFNGEAPEGTEYPYATFSIVSAPKDKTFTEEYTDALIQFDFYSIVNAAETRDIQFHCYDLFDENSMTMTGSTLIWMRMLNEIGGDDPEEVTTPEGTQKVWHGSQDYEAKTSLD